MWGTVSDEIAAGPRQRNHSRVRVPRDSWSHFIVSDSRLPHSEGPGPHIYISQEQGGPVIPSGTRFHFVASYDSQGYGGGIRTGLHTRIQSHVLKCLFVREIELHRYISRILRVNSLIKFCVDNCLCLCIYISATKCKQRFNFWCGTATFSTFLPCPILWRQWYHLRPRLHPIWRQK
jgi:hypothetical protein